MREENRLAKEKKRVVELRMAEKMEENWLAKAEKRLAEQKLAEQKLAEEKRAEERQQRPLF